MGSSSSEIRLSQIVEAIDGVDYFEGCLLGLPACNNDNPCSLHDLWLDTRNHCLLQKVMVLFDVGVISLSRQLGEELSSCSPVG